jgi:hypothetical protein
MKRRRPIERRRRKTPPPKQYRLYSADCMRNKAQEARRRKIPQGVLRSISWATDNGDTWALVKSYLNSEQREILEEEGYTVRECNNPNLFRYKITWGEKKCWF